MKIIELISKIEELGFNQVDNTPESANVRVSLWSMAMTIHAILMTGKTTSNQMRCAFDNRLNNLYKEIMKHGGPKRIELVKIFQELKDLLFES